MIRDRVLWLLLATAVAHASISAASAPSRGPTTPSACAVIPLAGAEPVDAQSPPDATGHDHRTASGEPVVRYEITARLDPFRHTIDGEQRLTWRNRSALPVCAIYLHMDLNAFEGAGSRFMAEQGASRRQTAASEGDWGYTQLTHVRQNAQSAVWIYEQSDAGPGSDRTVVRVDLPEPVAPGGSTTLDIGFHDQLPGARMGTGFYGSFHLLAHWFPQIAALELPGERGATRTRWNAFPFLGRRSYRDSGIFDVRLDVPGGYRVGASGEQSGGPVARGNRLIYRFIQHDAADFAWTADSRFAPPLEYRYASPGGAPVNLRVLYHPEHAAAAVAALDTMADAFAYYAHALRAYPYSTVTAVITPYNAEGLAGHTYPTLYTVAGENSAATGTAAGERLDLAALRGISELYFSSVLGADAQPALVQGLTHYWTARRLSEHGQTLHIHGDWTQRLGFSPALDGFSALRLEANLHGPADSETADAARIALTLHDLQEQVGVPAMDRGFWLFFQSENARDLGGLREALVEGSGQREPVERAFAQHIDGARLVDDSIASFSSEEVLPQPGYVDYKGKRIELTSAMLARAIRNKRKEWKQQHRHEQETMRGAFPYRTTVVVHRNGAMVPQVLQVKFADGSTRRIYWNDAQPSQRFSWVTPARAVSAQLDPQHQVLLDRNKLDDGRTLKADIAPARRWGGDVAAVMQVFSGFLVSL
jgi:hypothetical protein